MGEDRGPSWPGGAAGDLVTTNSNAYPVKETKQTKDKPTESTTLSGNANQTYFADARIRIPDDDDVSLGLLLSAKLNARLNSFFTLSRYFIVTNISKIKIQCFS